MLTCNCLAWSLTVGTEGLIVAVARVPEESLVRYGQMFGQAIWSCAFEVEGVAEGIVKSCKQFLVIDYFGEDVRRRNIFHAS